MLKIQGSLICILVIFVICSALENDPIVQTNSGQVRGLIKTSWSGRPFYGFKGIPYAKEPSGELRFKPPRPVDPWDDIFNATEDGQKCFQLGVKDNGLVGYIGGLDCLNLEVYTPTLPDDGEYSGPLPVLVFIYGGAYLFGFIDSSNYGPERYLDKDIVLVMMNYRLDVEGYLATNDGASPGNYGLLDQNFVLQWVQQNIAAFGGNPNQVTIAGESAGATSVHFHILSPKSTGLFNQAISESGSSLCPWAIVEDPLYYANEVAKLVNCSSDDTYEMVDCMRYLDPKELYKESVVSDLRHLILSLVPVVEPVSDGLFLWEDPLTLLQEGRYNQVPILMGTNRDEGCLLYAFAPHVSDNLDEHYWNVTLPILIGVFSDYRQNNLEVSYAIKDEYYTGVDLNDTLAAHRVNIDVLSDMFMRSWVVETVNLMAEKDIPVYFYVFNFIGNWSTSYYSGEADDTHAIELRYLFNFTEKHSGQDLNEEESAFSHTMVDLWTNFTIHGNPTPPSSPVNWYPTEYLTTSYLSLDTELKMYDGYYPDRMNFWIYEVPKIVYGENATLATKH